jgi:hypothetical protein
MDDSAIKAANNQLVIASSSIGLKKLREAVSLLRVRNVRSGISAIKDLLFNNKELDF